MESKNTGGDSSAKMIKKKKNQYITQSLCAFCMYFLVVIPLILLLFLLH